MSDTQAYTNIFILLLYCLNIILIIGSMHGFYLLVKPNKNKHCTCLCSGDSFDNNPKTKLLLLSIKSISNNAKFALTVGNKKIYEDIRLTKDTQTFIYQIPYETTKISFEYYGDNEITIDKFNIDNVDILQYLTKRTYDTEKQYRDQKNGMFDEQGEYFIDLYN